MPSVSGLEKSLKELAGIYTGSRLNSKTGVEFYLSCQRKWDASMAIEWDNLVARFILKLKETIGREPLKGRNQSESRIWRQPLKMSKLHCIAAHCMQSVESHGYLGAFSEQSFEHYQQTSSKLRQKHAHNKCAGSQICDDLQYSWIHSSPLLRKFCSDAEERRSAVSRVIRKRKFPFE